METSAELLNALIESALGVAEQNNGHVNTLLLMRELKCSRAEADQLIDLLADQYGFEAEIGITPAHLWQDVLGQE